MSRRFLITLAIVIPVLIILALLTYRQGGFGISEYGKGGYGVAPAEAPQQPSRSTLEGGGSLAQKAKAPNR
jgi:hypothetical protein